jgi:hypothetical protein
MYICFADVLPASQQTETITHNIQNSHRMTIRTPVRQLIHLTPVSGNPRSILLPVSLKDVKDIRTIKIINAARQNVTRKQQSVTGMRIATGNKATLQTKPVLVKSGTVQEDIITTSSCNGSVSEEMGDDSDSQYPRLQLTRKIGYHKCNGSSGCGKSWDCSVQYEVYKVGLKQLEFLNILSRFLIMHVLHIS